MQKEYYKVCEGTKKAEKAKGRIQLGKRWSEKIMQELSPFLALKYKNTEL